MYAPTATINGIIYVGGASDYQGGTVVDTTNSFSFNPAANTIGTIAPIPRATGETRGLNFNGLMYVMGGGRVAPNPSNEVDVYNPGTNTWSNRPAFRQLRGATSRPIPMAQTTSGSQAATIVDGITPLASMEIFNCPQASPTPSRDCNSNCNRDSNRKRKCDANSNRDCDCDCNCYCNGDRNSYCHRGAEVYADAQAASDTSASAVRSALAHVSSGTRVNSRVPVLRTALEEITRSAEKPVVG